MTAMAELRQDSIGADLRDADLSGAHIRGISLRAARLDGADLRGATLERVDLYDASLAGARLEKARFRNVVAGHARFAGARAARASFLQADLTGACFDQAEMPGAQLRSCELERASFAQTNLRLAHLAYSICDGASFRGALFQDGITLGSSFGGADFAGLRRFTTCREIIVELLMREAGDSLARVAMLGAVALRRDWCYAAWREFLVIHPDLRALALRVFAAFPESGFAEALRGAD